MALKLKLAEELSGDEVAKIDAELIEVAVRAALYPPFSANFEGVVDAGCQHVYRFNGNYPVNCSRVAALERTGSHEISAIVSGRVEDIVGLSNSPSDMAMKLNIGWKT